MKRISFITVYIFLFAAFLHAQVPDDALRNSWFIPGGTARYMSIGGAIGSLGGDITANNINPAGIGLYRTKEIVVTPGIMFNNNKMDYRGTNSSSSKTAFAYGATGFVIGSPGNKTNTSNAFSISINQLANFNNHTYYQGNNNVSSYSEQYLEELTKDGADIYAAENNYIFGSSLAYRTYLIDSVTQNGQLAGYKTLVPISTGVLQQRDQTTSGGYNELSFAYAHNSGGKVIIGGSLNVPISKYKSNLWYSETDATNNPNNDFADFRYNEQLTSNGVGLNLKFGIIYKPTNNLRLGIALHSPSFMGFEDEISSDMTTDTEAYAGTRSESSDNLNSGNPGDRSYNLLTPWRAIISGSYIINSVEDTKKQRGFITADMEYVDYSGSRYYAINSSDATGKDYYNSLNDVIKDFYKSAFNFRIGGELKFDPLAVRLGGAYYGSPYSESSFDANRILISGGIGYRKHGYFIDLTFAESINHDVSFPYLLVDKPNTYATWKNNRTSVLLTFGFKI